MLIINNNQNATNNLTNNRLDKLPSGYVRSALVSYAFLPFPTTSILYETITRCEERSTAEREGENVESVTEKDTSNTQVYTENIYNWSNGKANFYISELVAFPSTHASGNKEKNKDLIKYISACNSGTEASSRDGFASSAIPLPT